MPPNVTRLKAAETVALKLGDVLERALCDLRSLPRWRPAPYRRGRIEGTIETGVDIFHAWRDAFDL